MEKPREESGEEDAGSCGGESVVWRCTTVAALTAVGPVSPVRDVDGGRRDAEKEPRLMQIVKKEESEKMRRQEED